MNAIDDTPTEPAVSAPPPIVRSREQLAISQAIRVRGAVRLHRRIVTETVTETVEVRREELVITDLTADEISLHTSLPSDSTNQLSDREFDLILHEERALISTVVVPVERVHVRIRVVSGNEQIVETLREEHVDLLTEPSVTSPIPAARTNEALCGSDRTPRPSPTTTQSQYPSSTSSA